MQSNENENQIIGIEKETPTFAGECAKILKVFFTGKLSCLIQASTESKTPIFAVFATAFAIITGLTTTIVPRQFLNGILACIIGDIIRIKPGNLLNPTSFFMQGAIFAIVLFLLICSLVKLIHLIHRENVNTITIMNMVSTTFIPAMALFVMGSVLGFALYFLSILFIVIGSFTSIFMLYEGIKIESRTNDFSPIWSISIIAIILFATILCFIFVFIVPHIISELLSPGEEIIATLRRFAHNLVNRFLGR